MNVPSRYRSILPWLIPLAVLLGILAIASQNPIVGVLGTVAFVILGYTAVSLYYRGQQERRARNDPDD